MKEQRHDITRVPRSNWHGDLVDFLDDLRIDHAVSHRQRQERRVIWGTS